MQVLVQVSSLESINNTRRRETERERCVWAGGGACRGRGMACAAAADCGPAAAMAGAAGRALRAAAACTLRAARTGPAAYCNTVCAEQHAGVLVGVALGQAGGCG